MEMFQSASNFTFIKMLTVGLILLTCTNFMVLALNTANCKTGRYYLNQSRIVVGQNVNPTKYDFTVDYGSSNIRVLSRF